MSTGQADELARAEKAILARSPSRMVPDLARIRDMVDLLGHPERAFPSIHVTGTNGKTSTSRIIDALLRAFGMRTGRFTSPHLESVTERIAIDGEPLAGDAFAATYDEIAPYAEIVDARHEDRVTFHEMLTAMAFAAFADAPIDVGVIEVGMGGSWDATNVINAPVAVVTPISLDHQEWLGPSLTNIATEKAGIVHRGATLIAAPQEPEVVEVLRHRLGEVGATAAWAGLDFGVLERRLAVGGQLLTVQGRAGTYEDVFLPLHGLHQAGNAACALAAVEAFFGGANVQLDIEAVREGLRSADSPGRLEVVRRSPTVLLDAAHNPAGAATLAAAVSDEFSFSRLVGVVGVLADKDAAGILAALEPILYSVVVTANSSPRAASADALAASAVEIFGADRVRVEPRLDDAIEAAVEEAESGPDLGGAGVLVTGSIVTVGEARRLLRPRAGAG